MSLVPPSSAVGTSLSPARGASGNSRAVERSRFFSSCESDLAGLPRMQGTDRLMTHWNDVCSTANLFYMKFSFFLGLFDQD